MFEHKWFYINFPLWWLLIVYAALDLILIYTYQFAEVRRLWTRLYNSTQLQEHGVSEMDL